MKENVTRILRKNKNNRYFKNILLSTAQENLDKKQGMTRMTVHCTREMMLINVKRKEMRRFFSTED